MTKLDIVTAEDQSYYELWQSDSRLKGWSPNYFIRFCREWTAVCEKIRRLAKEKGGRKNE